MHVLHAICKVPTPLYAICKVPTPLYAICKVPTPLTLGSAFYVYNGTCSKNLITLLNHMNESYDTFQRYLTSVCEQMMEEEIEEDIFSPPVISGSKFIHFAINNADWHEKIPDG